MIVPIKIQALLLTLYLTGATLLAGAQNPGGVTGAALWLRADKGASTSSYFNVPAANRSASTSWPSLLPSASTLASGTSWAGASAVTGDNFTMDLGSVQTAAGVVTKGRADGAQWVTAYTVSYSTDNISYTSLGSFTGNTDQNTEVVNMFAASITARYIRITVTGISSWPSMRADVVQPLTPITTDNTSVGTWQDQGAAGNNVSQNASINQPVYRDNPSTNINFNPVITFNGSSQRLTDANGILGTSTYTNAAAFVISAVGAIGSQTNAIFQENGLNFGTQIGMFAPYNDNKVYWDGAFNTRVSQLWGGTVGTPYMWTGWNNNSLATKVSLRRNGFEIASSTNAISYTGNNGSLSVGSAAAGTTDFYNGKIADLVIFKTALTAADRNRVESYLAIKYGITLDQTSTQNYVNSASLVVWDASTNSSYNNNIAGIGRDDASLLNQKQSQSVNSGLQPVIGNVNIAASNIANTNNFATDLSFMLWGSDAGSAQFATPFVFGNLNNRTTRIWKIQETGSVGTVKVALPASQVLVSNPTLLISSDNVFDGTDTRQALILETLGGVQYYTATVDFTSGQYFSFAGFVSAPGGVVAGLKIWHKADAGVTSVSGSVTAWTNLVDGRQAINTVANQQPVLSTSNSLFNFNPYLDYTATTNTLYDAGATPFVTDGDISYFVSVKPPTTTDGQMFGVNATPSTSGAGSYDSYDWFFTNLYGGGATATYSPTLINTPQSIITFTQNGASNTMNAYANLTSILSGTGYTGQLGSGGYALGSDVSISGGDNASTLAQYSEHIAYNRVLTASEIQRVQSYLAIKTGVSLSQNYIAADGVTVPWNAAANSGYNNNIAGIGRDDGSALNQKQSQSVNSGLQPVIGNVNITATNLSNSNAFSNNQSFLLWGSDNGSTQFATSFVFGNLNNRVTRIWKMQKTGTIGVVKIALVASQVLVNNPTLLISTDNIFDGTDTRLPLALENLGGVNYYTATTDLTSVSTLYFTFAGYITAPGGVVGSVLWLKADAGTSSTLSGTAISQWNDVGASANNFTQATTGSQPVYSTAAADLLNFNPAVVFNGSKVMNNAAGIMTATGKTNAIAFTASRNIALTASTMLSGQGIIWYAPYNDGNIYWYGNVGVQAAWGGSIGSTSIITGYNTSTASPNRREIRRDGNILFNDAIPTSFTASAGNMSLGNAYNGQIGEVVYFDSYITATQRDQIESYLAVKYGITKNGNYLNTAGAVIWNASANAAYNYNIIGIGRDDATALHQKVSKSINAGTMLTMATSTDFTSINASAGRTAITADNNYLLIGDDNGTTSARISTGVAPGYNTRLARKWSVQNTNYTQDVSLLFTGLYSGPLTWNLIWDADGDFSSGSVNLGVVNAVTRQITINGTAITTGYLALMASGVDSDGDGVIDIDDLDNDNDGIKNTDECPILETVTPFSVSGGTTQTFTFPSSDAGFRFDIYYMDDAFQLNINGTNLALTTMETTSTCNPVNLKFADGTLFGTAAAQATYGFSGGGTLPPRIRVMIDPTGTVTMYGTKQPGDLTLYPLTLFNGNAFNTVTWNSTGSNTVIVSQPVCGPTSMNGVGVGLKYQVCDTDGDGIPNEKDLDSDNDGCPDYIEGGAYLTTANDVNNDNRIDGGVDASGIPVLAAGGQTVGVSQNALVSGCVIPGGVGNNLVFWYKADAGITQASGSVNQWMDYGGGYTATQSTGTAQPSYNTTSNLFNFNPTLSFNAAQNLKTAATLPGATTGINTYVVYLPGSSNYLWNWANSGQGYSNYDNNGAGDGFRAYSDNIGWLATTSPGLLGKPVLASVNWNTTGLGAWEIRNNGLQNTTLVNSPTAFTNVVNGTAYFNVGGTNGSTGYNGRIAEVIGYNAKASNTDRLKVETYLALKYGITLDQGTAQNYVNSAGTTIWDATANAYKFNIAGIGRDDLTAMKQKQSQSVNVNTNGQVAIGLGTIATSNTLNTSSFSADKTFLVWGDNGNTQSLAVASTTFNFNGFSNNVRMNRVWQVQNSGVNQSVTIQFPTASVGTSALPSGSCTQYVIIYSTDSTFTSGVTAAVPATSGANYSITRKFPQGVSYFTFAKVTQQAPGTVKLPIVNSSSLSASGCTNAPGWKYYYYDAGQTQKAFSVNWNGNTEPGGVSCSVTYRDSGYTQTSGTNQCNIMGRMLEILPAGGSFTVNGGVKVRLFFDSTEMINQLAPAALSQKWFKVSGNAASVIAANTGQNISGATWLNVSSSGEEDGADYVEFSGIQSFSTFGFASNTGVFPLPVKLESFTAAAGKCAAMISWKTAEEINTDRFIVEQSRDGVNFSAVATVPAKNNFGGAVYQQTIAQNEQQSYYRLKIINTNGTYTYSSVISQKVSCGQVDVISIYPNPLNGADKLGVHIFTTYRGAVNLTVYNAQGQAIVVKQVPVNSAETIFEMGVKDIPQGAYLLRCTTKDGVELSNSLKFIK